MRRARQVQKDCFEEQRFAKSSSKKRISSSRTLAGDLILGSLSFIEAQGRNLKVEL